ncbi:mechanosensitive ion channel family protein [Massilia sp. S19_KUP03_FR1]|uniref:mechanosensitive ion channel family protein n=1 Tax=Massilia sp. S19_KUP03_FR1 TaxID=3025503 RepID=UPI002FCD66F5
MKHMKHYLGALLIALTLPLPFAMTAAAQATAAVPAATAAVADRFDRQTPRSTITALIEALARHDYEQAGNYIDVPAERGGRQRTSGTELARRLQVLLDRGGSLEPFVALSNDPVGRTNDDLDVDREDVGSITIQGKEVPVLLARSGSGDQAIWKIARETASQLALANADTVAKAGSGTGMGFMLAGAPVQDWLLLVGLAAASFAGLWFLASIVLLALRKLVRDPETNGLYLFLQASLPPFSLLFAIGVFYAWVEELPVGIVARQTFLRYSGVVTAVAFVWFGLRLVDAISDLAISRMERRQRRQVISVVTLLRRTVKVLLLAFSAVGILDTFGINVTTGIAALGVGGIALALGAQKTVENLVGSVTVIADRPAQIGDAIKVGTVTGTVEDIGIRSTRIRTGERTIVTIPNGDFSARQIENLTDRDRFQFNPVIPVSPAVTAAQLQEAVGLIEGVLTGHQHVAAGARARFANITERGFNIETNAYIALQDGDASNDVRAELLHGIFAALEGAGIGLAFPAPTVVKLTER